MPPNQSANSPPVASTVTDLSASGKSSPSSQDLESAFALFWAESQKLEAQQATLQEKINLLTNELQQSNQRLAILLNAIPAGVVLLEKNIVLLHNPAILQFIPNLQIGRSFVTPKAWAQSIAPNEFVIESTGKESSNQRQTIQLIRIDDGERSFIQIQDITANIALHQKSQQESRLAAMGKMAAGIAHQFRTPLATALLYSSHLCDETLDPKLLPEFAQRIRKQLQDLEKLSQEMLRFISNKANKTALVPAAQIIHEAETAIRPLFDEKKVILQLHLEIAQDLMINADQKTLTNALIAILENALQISKEKQTVRLDAKREGKNLLLNIADQGPGIAAEMLTSLFEPFASTHANGTGLGLSIAKNAIESHRGTITAHSSKAGASFDIALPCISSQ